MPDADPRLQNQIDLILGTPERRRAIGEDDSLPGAAAHPADWRELGDVDYLYRAGRILAAPADVERVEAALRRVLAPERDADAAVEEEEEPDDVVIDVVAVTGGVAKLDFSSNRDRELRTVPAVLDLLDRELGAGVARPDTVLFVCPNACPATEPEEVPHRTAEPHPQVGTACCHGCGPLSSQDGRGSGVKVVVVDTGFLRRAAADRPWMQGVTGDEEDPYIGGRIRPYAGHGTHVAGDVRVMAPACDVVVKGAFLTAGADYETNIAPKLVEALAESPDVIVLTFAGTTRLGLSLPTFDDVYERHLRHLKGVVVVCPAGNDGSSQWMWPAAYPWTVSVGALDEDWRGRAWFSNHGGWVDVYAPGEGLVNAFAYGDYVCTEVPHIGEVREFDGLARWSGTSFSTPLVAGMIAARMSVTGENGRTAAASLLEVARRQAVPGVGAVLRPGDACRCRPEGGDRAPRC